MTTAPPLRIGVLGAARIAPAAIVRPARQVAGACVVAVAARDRSRAEAFARRHGIERACGGYEALVEDPAIDAIYNALPNALHARWTLAALAAGKHVLCEKPLTSNAAEAAAVAAEADRAGRVVMEAFHYRYHPLAARLRAIVAGGELGELTRVEAWLCVPLPFFSDIRYDAALAGGALMDVGCYAVHLARYLAGGEPSVTAARARRHGAEIDRAMTADLAFPGPAGARGATGAIHASLWSSMLLRSAARVVGRDGTLDVLNPYMPHRFHRVVVRTRAGRRVERLPPAVRRRPTYEYQLEAFCDAVLRGAPVATPPSDSVANMRVIDAIYAAAGMRPRGAGREGGAGS